MSRDFEVTVKLTDPFDNVQTEQVQAAIEKALLSPDAGLLGLNVQVSTYGSYYREHTRSSAWAWLTVRGVDPDSANDALNAAERFGTRNIETASEYVEIRHTERGKFTFKVLGGSS